MLILLKKGKPKKYSPLHPIPKGAKGRVHEVERCGGPILTQQSSRSYSFPFIFAIPCLPTIVALRSSFSQVDQSPDLTHPVWHLFCLVHPRFFHLTILHLSCKARAQDVSLVTWLSYTNMTSSASPDEMKETPSSKEGRLDHPPDETNDTSISIDKETQEPIKTASLTTYLVSRS